MLTKRQKQILDYIKKFINEKDYAPTIDEIKRHFRLSSLATVHKHIENLRNKDYLRKIENQPRSIQLNDKRKPSDLIQIPLLGTIAAGAPIE
ncbi:MAG: repressor LexA, partial [Candidatus Portnoybacteria bacterium]|nr:repressor LexA [Candidatus Portnoybacteria bacterium]